MQALPHAISPIGDALFLDVDGTLLDLQPHPDDVVADAGLLAMLDSIEARFSGALALVSGRPVDALDRIFTPLTLTAAGTHGAEVRLAGEPIATAAAQPLTAEDVEKLQQFSAQHEGLVLELKSSGMSLHYRQAPDMEDACRQMVAGILDASCAPLRLIDGKKVLELTAGKHNKGEAIRQILTSKRFAGRRPIFIGDDVTDEDGFRVVNELGGLSIVVGDVPDSAAHTSISDVAGVHAMLGQLVASRQD